MQPSDDQPRYQYGGARYGAQPYGAQPYGAQPYGGGPYAAPGDAPQPTVTRARPWAVALAALLAATAVVAAVGNPAVADAIYRYRADHDGFGARALQSLLTFEWRFGARGGGTDPTHLWQARLISVVVGLVLLFLFVAVVVRGRGTFWQAFFATWLSFITATMLATYVFAAVLDTSKFGTGDSKATSIFFAGFSGSSFALTSSVVLGLIVALVAGIVALLSRKRERVPAAGGYAPAAGPPGGWAPGAQPSDHTAALPAPGPAPNPSPWSDGSDTFGSRTTALPPVGSGDRGQHPTEVLPVIGPDASAATSAGPSEGTSDKERTDAERAATDEGDRTTQLPRLDDQERDDPHTDRPSRRTEE